MTTLVSNEQTTLTVMECRPSFNRRNRICKNQTVSIFFRYGPATDLQSSERFSEEVLIISRDLFNVHI